MKFRGADFLRFFYRLQDSKVLKEALLLLFFLLPHLFDFRTCVKMLQILFWYLTANACSKFLKEALLLLFLFLLAWNQVPKISLSNKNPAKEKNRLGPYRAIQGRTGPYRAIQGHAGTYWAIQGHWKTFFFFSRDPWSNCFVFVDVIVTFGLL